MIISRTPFRVSFFGGGTDYPAWYREHGGAVLAIAIDKYCYISCRYLPPFFEHKSRNVYTRVETVKSNREIEHPAVCGILRYMKIDAGVEMHYDADLPARTGLGSSSAFTVGLLNVLHALKRARPTKMELAREATYVEQEVLGECVGCQDQVMTANGGLCRIDFHTDDSLERTPVTMEEARLAQFQSHLLLCFTGLSRNAFAFARTQVANIRNRESELSAMHQMVAEGVAILSGLGSMRLFGDLLHEGWRLKRGLAANISSPAIDAIYEAARDAGAIGGKLLGAGGGGFMLLFAEPEAQARIRQRLQGLLVLPCRLDTDGTQIVFRHHSQVPG